MRGNGIGICKPRGEGEPASCLPTPQWPTTSISPYILTPAQIAALWPFGCVHAVAEGATPRTAADYDAHHQRAPGRMIDLKRVHVVGDGERNGLIAEGKLQQVRATHPRD